MADAPSVLRRATKSGADRLALMTWLSFCTTAAGVPAGATKPYHWSASKPSKPFTPDSVSVGTSGNKSKRFELETAMARNFPALTIGTKAGATVFAWGNFLTIVINFTLLAFVIFGMVKVINTARAKIEAEKPPAPVPEDVQLLREIRDSLKK